MHIEPTENKVAKQMRQIYCCKGAEFARPTLEAGWKEIWRLESLIAHYTAELLAIDNLIPREPGDLRSVYGRVLVAIPNAKGPVSSVMDDH